MNRATGSSCFQWNRFAHKEVRTRQKRQIDM